jgi:hypothetical protein
LLYVNCTNVPDVKLRCSVAGESADKDKDEDAAVYTAGPSGLPNGRSYAGSHPLVPRKTPSSTPRRKRTRQLSSHALWSDEGSFGSVVHLWS